MRRSSRDRGFTLIELITVIVILGLLAAVVAPRYFDMTDQARLAAAEGALAEGAGRFYMHYGNYLLDNGGSHPGSLSDLAAAAYLDLDGGNRLVVGDFRLTFAGGQGGGDVTITAEDRQGGGWSGVPGASETIPWPGP